MSSILFPSSPTIIFSLPLEQSQFTLHSFSTFYIQSNLSDPHTSATFRTTKFTSIHRWVRPWDEKWDERFGWYIEHSKIVPWQKNSDEIPAETTSLRRDFLLCILSPNTHQIAECLLHSRPYNFPQDHNFKSVLGRLEFSHSSTKWREFSPNTWNPRKTGE